MDDDAPAGPWCLAHEPFTFAAVNTSGAPALHTCRLAPHDALTPHFCTCGHSWAARRA